MENSNSNNSLYTDKMRKDTLASFVDALNPYLVIVLKTVNTANGISAESFCSELCGDFEYKTNVGDKEKALLSKDKYEKIIRDECPEHIYEYLDFQACVKCIRFGLPYDKNGNHKASIKDFFYSFFQFSSQAKRKYERNLSICIEARNRASHKDITSYEEDAFRKHVAALKILTVPFYKDIDFQKLTSPQELWKQWDEEIDKVLAAPVKIKELGQAVFQEDGLTEPQYQSILSGLKYLNRDVNGGLLYKCRREDKTQVIDALLGTPAVISIMGLRPFKERLSKENTSLLYESAPFTSAGRALLSEDTNMYQSQQIFLNAITTNFHILTDDTFLLNEAGQALLEKGVPSFYAAGSPICIDYSVSNELFRLFRSTEAKNSSDKFSMLNASQEEKTHSAEEDKVLHQCAKNALKTLRYLRENNVQEVGISKTPDNIEESIVSVLKEFPLSRFFLFTMNKSLVDAIVSQDLKNCVTAKVLPDGSVFLYRGTQSNLKSMLASAGTVEDVNRPAAGVLSRLPNVGDIIYAKEDEESLTQLRLIRKAGGGGEGIIYETSFADKVAKIYHRKYVNKERYEKISAMVSVKPKIDELCWPEALLYNASNEWVGFLMPKAIGKEMATTIFHPGRNFINVKSQGWGRREIVLIAANVAAAFKRMHSKKIYMADINPRNFIVRPDCSVRLVDCDSYQFDRFNCEVGTPLYTPPEIHRKMREDGKFNYGYRRTSKNELYQKGMEITVVEKQLKDDEENLRCYLQEIPDDWNEESEFSKPWLSAKGKTYCSLPGENYYYPFYTSIELIKGKRYYVKDEATSDLLLLNVSGWQRKFLKKGTSVRVLMEESTCDGKTEKSLKVCSFPKVKRADYYLTDIAFVSPEKGVLAYNSQGRISEVITKHNAALYSPKQPVWVKEVKAQDKVELIEHYQITHADSAFANFCKYYQEGDIVTATVDNIHPDYGVYFNVYPGLNALMKRTFVNAEINHLQRGDFCYVRIASIDEKEKRINLVPFVFSNRTEIEGELKNEINIENKIYDLFRRSTGKSELSNSEIYTILERAYQKAHDTDGIVLGKDGYTFEVEGVKTLQGGPLAAGFTSSKFRENKYNMNFIGSSSIIATSSLNIFASLGDWEKQLAELANMTLKGEAWTFANSPKKMISCTAI